MACARQTTRFVIRRDAYTDLLIVDPVTRNIGKRFYITWTNINRVEKAVSMIEVFPEPRAALVMAN